MDAQDNHQFAQMSAEMELEMQLRLVMTIIQ